MRANPRLVPIASCVILATVLMSCSRRESGATGAGAAAWALRVEPVMAPVGPRSSLPQLNVSGRGLILSWLEQSGQSTSTLKFSERTPSGWTEPTTVSSGQVWFLSYADPPSVLRRPDGTLVANWEVATDPIVEGSDLHLSYSRDNGKTWAKSFLPHHDGTMGQHAFPSFFELPGNSFGVVWLDARAIEGHPDNPDASPMSLRYAAFDASWKQTADAAVDTRVCDCCSTAAAVTSEGVLVAFRDRSEKEIRDISVSRLENGKWTETMAVHNDNFQVTACPVNGPMIRARGREAVVAWFTVKNAQGQAWAAFSNDAGRTWGEPIRLDEAESLGRVGVDLLEDGSAVASWVEFAENHGRFRVRRSEPSGMKSAPITVAGVPGSDTTGVPRVARYGDELVFAWSESTTPDPNDSETALTVKTAAARLPGTR